MLYHKCWSYSIKTSILQLLSCTKLCFYIRHMTIQVLLCFTLSNLFGCFAFPDQSPNTHRQLAMLSHRIVRELWWMTINTSQPVSLSRRVKQQIVTFFQDISFLRYLENQSSNSFPGRTQNKTGWRWHTLSIQPGTHGHTFSFANFQRSSKEFVF